MGPYHMNPQAKTINLLLYDGNLQGVISIEDTSWNAGELFSAPRDSVQELLETDACNKYGVYLLLSQDRVYVGQSSDLARRLNQHIIGKDWWESAVILTTKDDSLNHADIDYLESRLIAKAVEKGRLDCDNKNKGNPEKVSKFREVYLSQYLDEALFLMQLIGITVFSDERTRGRGVPNIDVMDVRTRLTLGKRVKGEAIQYLRDSGIPVGKNASYSVLQGNGTDFWINPRTTKLSGDWDIVLNDNQDCALMVLHVPAGALAMRREKEPGLVPRADKPELIDLVLDRATLVDRRSGTDFSHYLSARITY